ncbi:MAG: Eco57I restriction-modification methylase domain-containing protein, partial [Ktedonobacteraceae bacterium]
MYGIDLNPLAVELAKLSLWLITAAKDRPLSFLDHRLRTGNALIGSWLEDIAAGQHPKMKQAQKSIRQAKEVEKEAGQLTLPLLDDEFRQNTTSALDSITAIEHNPGVTIKDVKVQEAAYRELQQHFSEKYLSLANLGAALYYDLEISSDVWHPLADFALGRGGELAQSPQFKKWLDAANELAERKHFFHWELEFASIFATGGFSLELGNPPWVRLDWEDDAVLAEI